MHTIMVRQARCSHILVETQAEAYEIQNMIYNGADFAQLAAQRSKCPSGRQGGNLGWFGRGQMVKPFEDAAFSYNVGDMTIVQTQFGWHVLYITGQR
jgi:peptidyl-prolyl cis-trans isomerase C